MYYGHLHNHSNVSDGSGTPDDAYNYAKNVAGLDYFSTSNHVGYIVESEWASIKTAAEKYNEIVYLLHSGDLSGRAVGT